MSLIKDFTSRIDSKVSQEIFWIGFGQAAYVIFSVFLTKIVSSRLGQSEYGFFSLGLTIPLVINQIIFGPFSASVVRFYEGYREHRQLRSLLEVVRRIVIWMSLMLLAVGFVACAAVAGMTGPSMAWLFSMALVFGLIQSIQALINGMETASRHRLTAAVNQFLDPMVRLACVALGLMLLGYYATMAMAAFAAGSFLVLLWQQFWFLKRLSCEDKEDPGQFKTVTLTLWRYGRFYIVFGAFAWFQLAIDRWALKLFLSNEAVGLYFAAYQLASFFSLVSLGVFTQFVIPIIFQKAGFLSDKVRLQRVVTLIGLFLKFACVWILGGIAVTLVFGQKLLVLLTSEAFSSAAGYVPLLVLGLGLLQITYILGLVPTTFNDMSRYMWIRMGHSVLTVCMVCALAFVCGIRGVCFALIISNVLIVPALVWNNRTIIRKFSLSFNQGDGKTIP